MCAHAVRVALKGLKGVETVEVSLNNGLATVTLKPGNTVTMKQLRDAIGRNGFTTKGSAVVAAGQLLERNGGLVLHVSGSNEEFTLQPAGKETAGQTLVGKSVTVEGTASEISSGNSVAQLRFRSVTESKP